MSFWYKLTLQFSSFYCLLFIRLFAFRTTLTIDCQQMRGTYKICTVINSLILESDQHLNSLFKHWGYENKGNSPCQDIRKCIKDSIENMLRCVRCELRYISIYLLAVTDTLSIYWSIDWFIPLFIFLPLWWQSELKRQ